MPFDRELPWTLRTTNFVDVKLATQWPIRCKEALRVGEEHFYLTARDKKYQEIIQLAGSKEKLTTARLTIAAMLFGNSLKWSLRHNFSACGVAVCKVFGNAAVTRFHFENTFPFLNLCGPNCSEWAYTSQQYPGAS